jgi:hypothetical protein
MVRQHLFRRGARRRLTMGLATLLGGAPRGFFIPHRHAAAVTPCGYPALEQRLAAARPGFEALLVAIEDLAPALRRLGGRPPAPRFEQSWFPALDAAAAYAIVATRRPARIVEVGSGHSTRFLARAIADQGLESELTCIDPAPRAALDGLPIRWRRALLQDVGESTFDALDEGDVLFVDSSHVLMPGSDVDHILNRVLPHLAAGVLVHFHDVFLPDPYPADWGWRGYNEQQALGPLLQGEAYQVLFASHYVANRMPERLHEGLLGELPRPAPQLDSSLWLQKSA